MANVKRTTARRVAAILEGMVVVAAVSVIIGCLGVLAVMISDPERAEEWTSGLRPIQFYAELNAELLDDYAGTFAVAHNSGDSIDATLEAVSQGADVIEADVIALDGRLYAAHGAPPPVVGRSFFRGPPLDRVWAASAGAVAIKLDLKDSSPQFVDLVLRFLAQRREQRRVIVVSGDPGVLQRFAEEEPAVLRFLSIGNAGQFTALEQDEALAAVIDGVSIRHTLLDEERAGWLEERGIFTLAWTVNDLERVNELVGLGVDAVTTDNLAIMRLLGQPRVGASRLDALRLDPSRLEATPVSGATAPR